LALGAEKLNSFVLDQSTLMLLLALGKPLAFL
jgi:hypothetical protein